MNYDCGTQQRQEGCWSLSGGASVWVKKAASQRFSEAFVVASSWVGTAARQVLGQAGRRIALLHLNNSDYWGEMALPK